jgi:hypothetical protein
VSKAIRGQQVAPEWLSCINDMDPLRLATSLLTGQADRVNDLPLLKEALETQPSGEYCRFTFQFKRSSLLSARSVVTIVFQTVLPSLPRLDNELKAWMLEEVIAHALSKAPLPLEQKTMRQFSPLFSLVDLNLNQSLNAPWMP